MSTEPFTIDDVPGIGAALALMPLPGRSGDLDGDLARIALWQPDLVVGLTEATERAALGAADLPERLRAMGIAYRAFPIPDFGTPPESADWQGLSAELHAARGRGARLLLHCHGGKGRSGMVAARLLVESGMTPDAAIALVRKTRAGAIETEGQEAWVAVGGG